MDRPKDAYQSFQTQSMALVRLLILKTKMLRPLCRLFNHRRFERCRNGAGGQTMQKVRSTKEYNDSLVVDCPSGITNTSFICPRTQSFPGMCYSTNINILAFIEMANLRDPCTVPADSCARQRCTPPNLHYGDFPLCGSAIHRSLMARTPFPNTRI